MCVDVTDHPTTAVVINQRRQHLCGGSASRAIFTHLDVGVVHRHSVIVAARNRRGFGLRETFAHQIGLTGFNWRLGIESRHASFDHELQKELGLGVEHVWWWLVDQDWLKWLSSTMYAYVHGVRATIATSHPGGN